MQILYNIPYVASNSIKTKYDKIGWRNNKDEFKLWCEG
jgi:deoxyribodipyrimidine photo-lyase